MYSAVVLCNSGQDFKTFIINEKSPNQNTSTEVIFQHK